MRRVDLDQFPRHSRSSSQSFDLPLDGLDIQVVEESFSTFLEQLMIWRGQILEGADEPAPEPEPSLPTGMIRA